MAREYDHEYKVQAVKLSKEIGSAKAAKELGILEETIHTWMKAVRAGKLDIGEDSHTLARVISLSEEITILRKRVKEQDKNPSPEGRKRISGGSQRFFFAASRRKPAISVPVFAKLPSEQEIFGDQFYESFTCDGYQTYHSLPEGITVTGYMVTCQAQISGSYDSPEKGFHLGAAERNNCPSGNVTDWDAL